LSALVKFSRYYPSIANKILKIKLFKQDYNYDLEQALNTFIKVIITNEMKENTNHLTWPVIFNNIVAKTHNNGTVHIDAPLLSNVDIKGLFDEYFNFWMDNVNFKKMFDFKEIFNPDSDVFKILKSSVVFDFITDDFYEKDVLLNKENIFKLLQCDKEETFTEYNNNLHEYYVNNTGDKKSLSDCVKLCLPQKIIT